MKIVVHKKPVFGKYIRVRCWVYLNSYAVAYYSSDGNLHVWNNWLHLASEIQRGEHLEVHIPKGI